MVECLNSVGFIFDKVNTYIKKDSCSKYSKYYCQYCAWNNSKNCNSHSSNSFQNSGPIPGMISPCGNCTLNTQYKVCIFKLKKSYFVSSSLDISTSPDEAWEVFKKHIVLQRGGNFVISVTKCDNSVHSFYANMIKAKSCKCCDAVLLYFKYNIITLPTYYQQVAASQPIPGDIMVPPPNPYSVSCANSLSNITYNLKSCEYKNVRFYLSQNYVFNATLEPCGNCLV